MIVEHSDVERALRNLGIRRGGVLWGCRVWRAGQHHWVIGGSAPQRLLVTIDCLMSRLAFRARHGQNCMASNTKQGG
jgi:hypothetical protein